MGETVSTTVQLIYYCVIIYIYIYEGSIKIFIVKH